MNDNLTLNILGCGSATPTPRHNTSAQIIDYRSAFYMIDCGEGTQKQMIAMGLSPHRITHVFLSHLHGDHCLGLVPMLSSMALHNKGGEVVVHTSPDGERIMRPMINFFVGDAPFEVRFNTVDPRKPNRLLETGGLTVDSFPLYHRVPTMGFLFCEKMKPRHLRGDMLEFYQVPVYARAALKAGADFVKPDGSVVENSRLTTDPSPSRSYAYCSDTMFNPAVAEAVAGVDLLYHEATYDASAGKKATARGHSTSEEAARIAAMAGVGTLMLGHFSKAADERLILKEARAIFPDSMLASEGMRYVIGEK